MSQCKATLEKPGDGFWCCVKDESHPGEHLNVHGTWWTGGDVAPCPICDGSGFVPRTTTPKVAPAHQEES